MKTSQHVIPVAIFAALAPLTLNGCARYAAPSYSLFGAYFPASLVCGVLGIIAAVVARIAFIKIGLSKTLPFQLFVCASIGVCFAILGWLLWFGQ